MKKIFTVRNMCRMALLVALTIIFSRFLTVKLTESLKLSTTFIPLAVCAMLLGPVPTVIVAALADFLKTLLFNNFSLAFNPLITLTAALTGLIFGLFLYRRELRFFHILLAVVINLLAVTWGLNTLILAGLMGVSFLTELTVRLPQGIMAAVQLVVIPLLARYVVPPLRRVMQDGERRP